MARGLPTGGQGSKVYVLCAEPKEHKHFRPGTRPGGFGFPAGRIGDRGDREIVYVPNAYVPFPAPKKFSGRKKEPKPRLSKVRIFSSGVGVLHMNGWGPESSIRPSKPGKSNFLGGISRDFAGISRGGAEKFERKKSLCSISVPKNSHQISLKKSRNFHRRASAVNFYRESNCAFANPPLHYSGVIQEPLPLKPMILIKNRSFE